MARKQHTHSRLPLAWLLGQRELGRIPQEQRLRYVACTIICVIATCMFALMLAINIMEENHFLILPLGAATLAGLLSYVQLHFFHNQKIALFGIFSALFLLSAYLVISGGIPWGSVIWFFIYPSAMMFCMGLRLGSLVFLPFFGCIIILFSWPVHDLLPLRYSASYRLRYIIALAGAFAFAWLSEYVRAKAYQRLTTLTGQLETHAFTDYLTGLRNRRAFYGEFARVQAAFTRNGKPFSIIMADLDHFKAINDRYGHHCGDAVLQHVADIISSGLEKNDSLFRWGGEEFVIILDGRHGQEAYEAAEKLRRAVERVPCPYLDEKVHITLSFGVHGGTALPPDDHMDLVDRLLYLAKAAGRNKVVGDAWQPV